MPNWVFKIMIVFRAVKLIKKNRFRHALFMERLYWFMVHGSGFIVLGFGYNCWWFID
jgi:hypothetical protein